MLVLYPDQSLDNSYSVERLEIFLSIRVKGNRAFVIVVFIIPTLHLPYISYSEEQRTRLLYPDLWVEVSTRVVNWL